MTPKRKDTASSRQYVPTQGWRNMTMKRSVGTQTEVSKLKKVVKNMKDAFEKKSLVTVHDQTMGVAGTVTNISNMAQGSTGKTRDGNKVKSYSLTLMGIVSLASDKQAAAGRMCIIIDHDQHGVIPAITDLWNSVADFAEGRPRNLTDGVNASFKRFTVLWDYPFVINPAGAAGGVNSSDVLIFQILEAKIVIPKYYKRIFHYISYSGNTNAIGDQNQGSIFLFHAAKTASTVVIEAESVYKYTDN